MAQVASTSPAPFAPVNPLDASKTIITHMHQQHLRGPYEFDKLLDSFLERSAHLQRDVERIKLKHTTKPPATRQPRPPSPQLVYLKDEFISSLREPVRQRVRIRLDPNKARQNTVKPSSADSTTSSTSSSTKQFVPQQFSHSGPPVSSKGLRKTLRTLLQDSEKRINHCKFGGRHTDSSFGRSHVTPIAPRRQLRKSTTINKDTPNREKAASQPSSDTDERNIEVVDIFDIMTPSETAGSVNERPTTGGIMGSLSLEENELQNTTASVTLSSPSLATTGKRTFITQRFGSASSSKDKDARPLLAPSLSTLLPHIFPTPPSSSQGGRGEKELIVNPSFYGIPSGGTSSMASGSVGYTNTFTTHSSVPPTPSLKGGHSSAHMGGSLSGIPLPAAAVLLPHAKQAMQVFAQSTNHVGPLQYRRSEPDSEPPPPAVVLPPTPPQNHPASGRGGGGSSYRMTLHEKHAALTGQSLSPSHEEQQNTFNPQEVSGGGENVIHQFRKFQQWEEASQQAFNTHTVNELHRCDTERRQCFDKKFETLYKLLANDNIFHTSWNEALKDMNTQVSIHLESDYRDSYKKRAIDNLQILEVVLRQMPVETKDTDTVLEALVNMVSVDDPLLDDQKFEELMNCVPAHRYLLNEVVTMFDVVRHLFGVSDAKYGALVNERLKKFEAKKIPIHFAVKREPTKEFKTGTLHVTIINAGNLEARLTSRLDPYVTVKCSTDKHEFKSSIKHNTLRPVWNEKFSFHLPLHSSQAMLDLTVYDSRDSHDPSQHEAIGFGRVILDTLPTGEKKRWKLQLKGARHGQLSIELLHEVKTHQVQGIVPNSRSARQSTVVSTADLDTPPAFVQHASPSNIDPFPDI